MYTRTKGYLNYQRSWILDLPKYEKPLLLIGFYLGLLHDASYQRESRQHNGSTVILKRGEAIVSERSSATSGGVSRYQIKSIIEKLRESGLVSRSSSGGSKVTVLTLLKYDEHTGAKERQSPLKESAGGVFTLEEVKAEILLNNYNVSAEHFYKTNKNRTDIKNWKSLLCLDSEKNPQPVKRLKPFTLSAASIRREKREKEERLERARYLAATTPEEREREEKEKQEKQEKESRERAERAEEAARKREEEHKARQKLSKGSAPLRERRLEISPPAEPTAQEETTTRSRAVEQLESLLQSLPEKERGEIQKQISTHKKRLKELRPLLKES